MGCLLVLFAVLVPRTVMVLIFLLSDAFTRAYDTLIWPLLGFIFMPYTTLAWMGGKLGGAEGRADVWTLLLVLAVIVDLLHLGGGGRTYRTYSRRRR